MKLILVRKVSREISFFEFSKLILFMYAIPNVDREDFVEKVHAQILKRNFEFERR